MARRREFLIVVPVNKPAYAKEFGCQDKAWQHVTDKCGRLLRSSEALLNGAEYAAVAGCSKKKTEGSFNRRASEMCGVDLFGPVVLGRSFENDVWEGFTLSQIENLTEIINDM